MRPMCISREFVSFIYIIILSTKHVNQIWNTQFQNSKTRIAVFETRNISLTRRKAREDRTPKEKAAEKIARSGKPCSCAVLLWPLVCVQCSVPGRSLRLRGRSCWTKRGGMVQCRSLSWTACESTATWCVRVVAHGEFTDRDFRQWLAPDPPVWWWGVQPLTHRMRCSPLRRAFVRAASLQRRASPFLLFCSIDLKHRRTGDKQQEWVRSPRTI
jgi:hypothetical protein